jgi:hypothetical protein
MRKLLDVENISNPAPGIQSNFEVLDSSITAATLTVEFSDFAAAATSETITLVNLPVSTIVFGVVMELNEAFDGGALSAATIEFGTTGDDDKFLTATDIFSSPSGVYDSSGGLFLPGGPGTTTPFKATIRLTGENAENLTQGNLTVKVLYAAI